MKIIAVDNLNRESVADRHVLGNIPENPEMRKTAEAFCTWMNSFQPDDCTGTFYIIVDNDYRLSRGMEDLI